MKFVLATAALCATGSFGATLNPMAIQAYDLQQRYATIAPKLASMGLGDTTMWNVDSLIDFNSGYNNIDMEALAAAGYVDLVAALAKSAELGLAAGEKGYAALAALETGDMILAKSLGDEANEMSMASSAALPAPTAISAETIDVLKASGQHRLADSLANAKRMIAAVDFNLKFMGSMAGFGKDEAGLAKTGAAIASRPAVQVTKPLTAPTLAAPFRTWNTWNSPIVQRYPVAGQLYYY